GSRCGSGSATEKPAPVARRPPPPRRPGRRRAPHTAPASAGRRAARPAPARPRAARTRRRARAASQPAPAVPRALVGPRQERREHVRHVARLDDHGLEAEGEEPLEQARAALLVARTPSARLT